MRDCQVDLPPQFLFKSLNDSATPPSDVVRIHYSVNSFWCSWIKRVGTRWRFFIQRNVRHLWRNTSNILYTIMLQINYIWIDCECRDNQTTNCYHFIIQHLPSPMRVTWPKMTAKVRISALERSNLFCSWTTMSPSQPLAHTAYRLLSIVRLRCKIVFKHLYFFDTEVFYWWQSNKATHRQTQLAINNTKQITRHLNNEFKASRGLQAKYLYN